jgi:protoheme IX farnesyltransferase
MAVMNPSSRRSAGQRLAFFFELCKPRVNSLIVFTAMIGMFLATPSFPPLALFVAASVGIALVAGAAAAINCLIEQQIDARMARTRARPTARGEVSAAETLTLATLVGGCGLWVLHAFVNPLTMWLTLATFLGYAVIYTVLLKPATPMNIVIGGASGAMPPLLGWAAMTGEVGPEALVLFLIIFIWTPPHFWALACYRCADYAKLRLADVAGDPRHSLHLPAQPALRGHAQRGDRPALYPGDERTMVSGAALILDALFLVYSVTLWRSTATSWPG